MASHLKYMPSIRTVRHLSLATLMIFPLNTLACGFISDLATSKAVSTTYTGKITLAPATTTNHITTIPLSFTGGEWHSNSAITIKEVDAYIDNNTIFISVITCLATGSAPKEHNQSIQLKDAKPGSYTVIYINPDKTTFDYLQGKERVPTGTDFDAAVEKWKTYASDVDAQFDDDMLIEAKDISPTVTWGITPGQALGIDENTPDPEKLEGLDQNLVTDALDYMQLKANTPIKGTHIDVAFIGSCTNGRLSDFEAVAKYLDGKKVAKNVKAIAVPGSEQVDKAARALGLHEKFEAAGFEWRLPGCSMCLAMNPDKLVGDEVCASSSNRNFVGRQGSPTGRTILMSPIMVAAAAIEGKVADAREVFGIN